MVISLTGQDSLLVYTYENILYHYVINTTSAAVTLVPVGQIALNGIVRAPARVRAVSWILPDHQLRKSRDLYADCLAYFLRRRRSFTGCQVRIGGLPSRR